MKFIITVSNGAEVFKQYEVTGVKEAERVRRIVIDADVQIFPGEVIRSIDLDEPEVSNAGQILKLDPDETACPECNGSGKIRSSGICKNCGGSGKIKQSNKPISVVEFKMDGKGKPILEPCPECQSTNIIFFNGSPAPNETPVWQGKCNGCGYMPKDQHQASEVSAMIWWNMNVGKEK